MQDTCEAMIEVPGSYQKKLGYNATPGPILVHWMRHPRTCEISGNSRSVTFTMKSTLSQSEATASNRDPTCKPVIHSEHVTPNNT